MYMQAQAAQQQHQATQHQMSELQWEVQHAWEQHQQADRVHKAALQAAQDRLSKLESDNRQSVEAAGEAKEVGGRAQADAARLAQDLAATSVCCRAAQLQKRAYSLVSCLVESTVSARCCTPAH